MILIAIALKRVLLVCAGIATDIFGRARRETLERGCDYGAAAAAANTFSQNIIASFERWWPLRSYTACLAHLLSLSY